MITVGQLKKKLEEFDDDLPVIAYAIEGEEGGFVSEVYLEEAAPEPTEEEGEDDDYEGNMTYFGGDHPFSYSDVKKAVFIAGDGSC